VEVIYSRRSYLGGVGEFEKSNGVSKEN